MGNMKKRSNTALVDSVQELQRELEDRYHDLTVSCRGKEIVISGTFPLLHKAKVLDRYQIEIIWNRIRYQCATAARDRRKNPMDSSTVI